MFLISPQEDGDEDEALQHDELKEDDTIKMNTKERKLLMPIFFLNLIVRYRDVIVFLSGKVIKAESSSLLSGRL